MSATLNADLLAQYLKPAAMFPQNRIFTTLLNDPVTRHSK